MNEYDLNGESVTTVATKVHEMTIKYHLRLHKTKELQAEDRFPTCELFPYLFFLFNSKIKS